jgi:transposase
MILIMKSAIDQLPNDPKLLKEIIVEGFLHRDQEIAVLKEQIALLKQMVFGRKSEKYQPEPSPLQLQLSFGEEQECPGLPEKQIEEPSIEIPAHKRRKRGRKLLSDALPREERVIDIPERDKQCECGFQKTVIGKETSEQLEYIPAKCKVIVNVRPKYACRNCEGTESNKPAVMIAPPPAQIIPKSFATASLLAYIVTSKYVDSLPFYRLSNMFSRHGVQLSRATMCNWVLRVTALLKPMIEAFLEQIINSSYVHADETPFQVLKEVGRKAEQQSYMWVIKTGHADRPTILFTYSPSRAGKIPKQIFSDFKGYIQTDGYAGYNYIKDSENQTQLGCWAHVRRMFHNSIKAAGKNAMPGIAHKAFKLINGLYKIESEAKEADLSHEEIKELRQEKAKPLLKDFKKKLTRWKSTVVPGSNTGKAIKYTLGQWDKLLVYLEEGWLKIDNNSAENAIRPFAVGRKNWLFADTSQGAAASATIYSILETAKANDLEPFWYMYALLEKLPELKTKEDLIPWTPQNIDKQIVDDLRKKHQNPNS